MFGKFALSSAMVLAMSSVTMAETVNWTALLDQAQATNLATQTKNAQGQAEGTLDTETGKLTYTVTFEDTSAAPTAAHFHGPAAMGADAPPVVTLESSNGMESPIAGEAMITPEQVQELLGGMWYINLHTEQNPAGELRGQVEKAM